jgi:acyl-CoA dehydrogenase
VHLARTDEQDELRHELREYFARLMTPELRHEALAAVRVRLVAARCVEQAGSCRGALALAASYATGRHPFGRPVGSFQAVAHQAADACIDTEGVPPTGWRAVWLLANHRPCTAELAIAVWGTTRCTGST